MQNRKIAAIACVLLTTPFAFADASYQTTDQITGGQFVDALKGQAMIGKMVDKMFAPTNRILMVHGNQKAEIGKDSTEITDLDKEQIIRIDNAKKTYTITTFEQMRQAMKDMPAQMEKMQQQMKQQPKQQMPDNISFSTSVKNTGVTKVVNGLTAQEQVITITMTVTDSKAPTGQPSSAPYTVTTDVWIAPDPPEIKEIQDFDIRFGQKLMEGVDTKAMMESLKAMADNNPAMAQMFGGHPGSAEAMSQMTKEMAKIKGTRILEVTSMGGDAPAQPAGAAPAPAAPAQSSGSVVGQVATDTATQTASSESSRLGVVGSALSSSVLNAFHKKKATPPPAPAAAATPAAPATPGGAPATQHVVLMEQTKQMTNFSQEAIPASAFQIPAGFKQIQSPKGM